MRPLKPSEIVLEDWQKDLPAYDAHNPLYDAVFQWSCRNRQRCPPELGERIRRLLYKDGYPKKGDNPELTNDGLREMLKVIHGEEIADEDLNLFRDLGRPDGKLMTAEVCKQYYRISGSNLSKASKRDPTIRRKNPAGRGYVYRYAFVRDECDRKDRDE